MARPLGHCARDFLIRKFFLAMKLKYRTRLVTNVELGLFVYFTMDIIIIHFTFAASETQNKPVAPIESP